MDTVLGLNILLTNTGGLTTGFTIQCKPEAAPVLAATDADRDSVKAAYDAQLQSVERKIARELDNDSLGETVQLEFVVPVQSKRVLASGSPFLTLVQEVVALAHVRISNLL